MLIIISGLWNYGDLCFVFLFTINFSAESMCCFITGRNKNHLKLFLRKVSGHVSWAPHPLNLSVQFNSVTQSCPALCDRLQHTRLPCPWPTPGAYSNSCPSSWWCHPTISSSDVPFASRLQSFPASGSFPVSQFFTSGGQSIRLSALALVLPMNIQDWFPLGLTGWISLKSKELSKVFSNTIVQKHQFFSAQLSL